MLIKRKKSKRHQLIVGVFPKKIASEIRKIMHISSNWQKDYFLHVSFAGCFIAALYRSESRKWFLAHDDGDGAMETEIKPLR